VKRLLAATMNSYRGGKYLFTKETAFQQEIYLLIFLIPVIFYVHISNVERAVLFLSVLLVLIVEVLNTAIEKTIDRIGYEMHELSGLVTDIASFAVLLSLFTAVVIWLVILL